MPEIWELIAGECVPGGTKKNHAYVNDQKAVVWLGVEEAGQLALADAQTSGGLLMAVSKDKTDTLLARLEQAKTPACAVIGETIEDGAGPDLRGALRLGCWGPGGSMMKHLLQLPECGQSYWLDNLSRAMIKDGTLKKRVTAEGLRGVTSNPTIFNRAISKSSGITTRRSGILLARGGD